jgi:hypothetical protein
MKNNVVAVVNTVCVSRRSRKALVCHLHNEQRTANSAVPVKTDYIVRMYLQVACGLICAQLRFRGAIAYLAIAQNISNKALNAGRYN